MSRQPIEVYFEEAYEVKIRCNADDERAKLMIFLERHLDVPIRVRYPVPGMAELRAVVGHSALLEIRKKVDEMNAEK